MSNTNGVLAPFLFCLVLTCVYSHTNSLMVLGSSLVQQQPTLHRPDPLLGFKDYTGGYNVTNKHYLASAVFTGGHSYAIAGVWLLCGLGFGIFLTCKNHIMSSDSSPIKDYLNYHYLFIFLLAVLFTLLAIVATSLVLAANESSLYRTKKFKRTIMDAGRDTHRKIHKVIKAMTEMQILLRPYEPATSQRLYDITHILARVAQSIRDFVQISSHAIDLGIRTSHILHLVVVAFNLALLVASLALLLLHWHPGFIIIIFVCWILTAICWALTGFDFFLQTFMDDTCTTFQDFQQHPHNSSLSSMIPCLDPLSSDQLLTELGSTMHNFIYQMNLKMEELHMLLPLDKNNIGLLGEEKICNPFSGSPNFTYIPDRCSKDNIPIKDLPNILSGFTCYKGKSPETCTTEGKFIPETLSDKAMAYSHSVENMLNIFPDLESLTRCTTIKIYFSEVVSHQCKPFRASIRLLWSSILSLSICMMILVLIWVVKDYKESGRHFSRCSIFPSSGP